LNHEYNILPKAGSRLGSKHSDESITKISDAKKGANHPNYGKTLSDETKIKISPPAPLLRCSAQDFWGRKKKKGSEGCS